MKTRTRKKKEYYRIGMEDFATYEMAADYCDFQGYSYELIQIVRL